MNDSPTAPPSRLTAFLHGAVLASGSLAEVAAAVAAAIEGDRNAQPLVFDDATGRIVDLDLRGTAAEVAARLPAGQPPRPARGRPRLGVMAREVTLLPRHWDWLAGQPGGASAALRRLVEHASRERREADEARARVEAAYRFLAAIAGDLPGFEEACRALFASDRPRFMQVAGSWPPDVEAYAARLAWPDEVAAG